MRKSSEAFNRFTPFGGLKQWLYSFLDERLSLSMK